MKIESSGDDELEGGAIRKAKREEIHTSVVPQKQQVPAAAPVGRPVTSARTTGSVPNLVQRPVMEVAQRSYIANLHPIAKRASGKGARFDAPDVRHHVTHSLSKTPRLLHAYLHGGFAV